jgi:ubiquitin-conjugating enzyme E2 M
MDGNVCLNILRDDWKPILTVNAVILGLIFLFIEPNPNDPLNKDAAELMRDDYSTFEDTVIRSLKGEYIDGVEFPKFN